ncbi:hypothetical protein HAX54_003220 [Datura stramonium]|uniref:Telomere-associated protein Rif1 N-terminal domain-containing protein n=1 Tax=Datura stramonium TaxID=4076 RepID=A0ABS8T6I0_DATST|nr:hypothetical protein [Datura stramonium]
MENFKEQLEQIQTLLSSNKPLAYSTLLHLQQQSGTDPSLVRLLADSSSLIVPCILADVSVNDEEIAAQALKCLGFMIYHPSIVGSIKGDDAKAIVDSLVEVITTSKIKSVCNLGVWCISMQQFNSSLLDANLKTLLRAITYALDNPIGSLSITFEAMQALMKLASTSAQNMRAMSNIWAPPVYGRLVSSDKRERDMSERCLQKVSSVICPPPVILSKALVTDLKKTLLLTMEELLNQGLKIQTLQVWRWFMCLLGPYGMKYKHLVNKLLKIPEQTFTDLDPQIQSASLVAWEGLIDALICSQLHAPESNALLKNPTDQAVFEGSNPTEADGFSKKIKLVMTPLIGIVSSNCDASVHVSCLNTWSYLLYKLDKLSSSHSVVKTVWEPILEVVIKVGPVNKNIWTWSFCIELLNNFISAGNKDVNSKLNDHEAMRFPESAKYSWKYYPIKWSPLDLGNLEFFLNTIHDLIMQGSNITGSHEVRTMTYCAASSLFRSLLRSAKHFLKSDLITYDEVILSLHMMLKFLKSVYENMHSRDGGIDDLLPLLLQLLEAFVEELEPSILQSPLYKVALDLKNIKTSEPVHRFKSVQIPEIYFMNFMEKVSPVTYITLLYFHAVTKATLKAPDGDIVEGKHKYVKLLLSSYEPLEILHLFVSLLYTEKMPCCFEIWVALANCLKDYIDNHSFQSLFKLQPDSPGCAITIHFLCYPFAAYSFSKVDLKLQHVIEAWKSLHVSLSRASEIGYPTLTEDLFSMLCSYFNEALTNGDLVPEPQSSVKGQDIDVLLLFGEAMICAVEQASLIAKSEAKECESWRSRNIRSSLEFASCFMKLSRAKDETNVSTSLIEKRLLSSLVHLVGCLHLQKDITLFIEIMTSTLLLWLSHIEAQDNDFKDQLQQLWLQTLNCLQKMQSIIEFNSSFLQLQELLLEKTLDHPDPLISSSTVNYWNSTFGEQTKLDYPQCLLPVLDKLSRKGKIKLCKVNLLVNDKGSAELDKVTVSNRYKVPTTLRSCSKRVELVGNAANSSEGNDRIYSKSKRRHTELTEHQKEVRRAQQGRSMDCSGHGPGIRTYTSVDFSQGNEESQESQDIRDADSILEMLRKS